MLRVAGFIEDSITDGVGIRYVIFAQGCKHNCEGCHNPETHSMSGGALFSIDRIMRDIKKYKHIDGITLSGGDPFFQPGACYKLLKRVKEELRLNVWVYTGFTFETLLKIKDDNVLKMLQLIDVIVDGKYEKDKKDMTLKFMGSSNQRIIDVQRTLELRDKGDIVQLELD